MRLLLVLKLKLLVLSRPRRLAFARAKSSNRAVRRAEGRGDLRGGNRPSQKAKRGIPIEDGVMEDHTKTRN